MQYLRQFHAELSLHFDRFIPCDHTQERQPGLQQDIAMAGPMSEAHALYS